MPQGFILSLLIFLLYIDELFNIIESQRLTAHSQADDNLNADDSSAAGRFTDSIACLQSWMCTNRLKLRSSRLALDINWSRLVLQCQSMSAAFCSAFDDLGATVYVELTLKDHVTNVCQSCYYQLRQLG